MEEVDGLLAKAEDYFGRKTTATCLAIVGLGAVAAAARSIFVNIAQPAYALYTKTGLTLELVTGVGQIGLLLGLFLMLLAGLARDRAERRAFEETDAVLNRAQRLVEESQAERDRAFKDITRLQEDLAAAELMLEASAIILRDQGVMGEDQADMVLSLLKSGPESAR